MRRILFRALLVFFMAFLSLGAFSQNVEILKESLTRLKNHISGTSTMNSTQIRNEINLVDNNIASIGNKKEIIEFAFQLVDVYENSSYGPLFVTSATKNGFSRSNTSGKEIHHALFAVMQGILDYSFTPENIAKYPSLFTGKKFESSSYFPGAVNAPENSDESYEIKINASHERAWGASISGELSPARRPTGCYLAPGSMVKVTVPQSMVDKGYSVRVGAHSWDLVKKSTIKRLDRVSLVYPIAQTETVVANPLGGGIYIEVPYLADAGVVAIQIQNALRSPFFSARSFDKTTLDEWQNIERNHLGPWADFESDKFMMQVPTDWIYSFGNPLSLLEDWDKAMDAISELFGKPLIRSKTVLYVQIDVIMRGNANYPGYPQSNYAYNPNTKVYGYKDHWMLKGPQSADWTVFHEVGHYELITKFKGETESLVNLPYVAINNKKFGTDLDVAFGNSISGWDQVSLDQAAIMWMVTENFRNGNPMNNSNKPGDEFKYQHRGHAKYVEIAKLFGWEVLEDFYKDVNEDYMNGGIDYPANCNADPIDSRILRMSRAADVDLRPLVHFWGIQPENQSQLKSAIEAENLPQSELIYDKLVYYKTIIPMNNQEFNKHAYVVYPNGPKTGKNPLYGDGWYETWIPKYSSSHGNLSVSALQDIIDLYFPGGRPETITKIITLENKSGTSLYPNPCNNILTIEGAHQFQIIEIFNICGAVQEVKRNSHATRCSLDLSKLDKGLYLVKLIGPGKSETFKVLKN